jgi:hypothetical protein
MGAAFKKRTGGHNPNPIVAAVGDDDGARRGHRDTARAVELGDGAEAVGEARGAAARQRRDGPACTRTRTCVCSLGNVRARVRVCARVEG